MGSLDMIEKPHAVCIPFPAQGHITPMLKLAKLLHSKGFYITFVNTDYNHRRLLLSRGLDSLKGVDSFRFESIPDGLPPSHQDDVTQDIPSLCASTTTTCLLPFRDLVAKLNATRGIPPVTCIVSDGVMAFTLAVSRELQIPEVLFWTTSACGFMGYVQYSQLLEKGIIPLKDDQDLSNGYLDTQIDWIPGMKDIRLRDLPSFLRTTNRDDIMLRFLEVETQRASQASAIILNSLEDLEHNVLEGLRSTFQRVYAVGPLPLLCNQMKDDQLKSLGSNLWKEEMGCLEWLDRKDPRSVVYVNFGSITVMTPHQLIEFAWGLAASNHPFLWVIRPDLVKGESAVLPPEFLDQTRERSLLLNWVPQEEVLAHPSIGGFLTHSGWNSTLESIFSGVPMICWPFFAEQPTNCRFACTEWGIGMEIDNDVKRDEVEELVRELMEGEKGKEMGKKAMEWKERAKVATKPGGSSYLDLDRLIKEVLRG